MLIKVTRPEKSETREILPSQLKVGEGMRFFTTDNILVRLNETTYLKIYFSDGVEFISDITRIGSNKGVTLPKGTELGLTLTL